MRTGARPGRPATGTRRISGVPIALLPGIVLLLAGCYTYRPVSRPPPAGIQVRIELDEGRDPLLGGRPDLDLRGTLVGYDEEAVTVAVPGPQVPRRYRRGEPAEDTLRIANERVSRLEERRFSAVRTALLAGTVAAAAALVVDLSGEGEGGADFPGSDDEPVRSLLLRVIPR